MESVSWEPFVRVVKVVYEYIMKQILVFVTSHYVLNIVLWLSILLQLPIKYCDNCNDETW